MNTVKIVTLGALAAGIGGAAPARASISECAAAWKSTGAGNCATAVAVCAAESGGNTGARNVNSDSHHSVDRGLWQINNYWHPEVSDSCAYSANCNANAAKSISSGGTNWTPWATYNGGAYKAHLSSARSACGQEAPELAALDAGLVGGEPASCTHELSKLCGHCGGDKSCWLSCAKQNEGALLKAGCHKPSAAQAEQEENDEGWGFDDFDRDAHVGKTFETTTLSTAALAPAVHVDTQTEICVLALREICGACRTDKMCWTNCAQRNEPALISRGCKAPASHGTHDTEERQRVPGQMEDLFLAFEYEEATHCTLLAVPGGYKSAFWTQYGYKYDHFKKGRCPSKYNYINKRVNNVEGDRGVTLVVRGIHKPIRSFRDIIATVGSEEACPADPCECCPHDGKGPGACPCLCGGGWCKRCCQ